MGLIHLKSLDDIRGAARRFLKIANDCELIEDGQTVVCRASIGITAVRQEDTIESLVSRADRYMYLAKKRTGSQIVTDFDV